MREISGQMSVSYSVVREAVNRLAEEGVLRIDARRGVFVSDLGIAVRDIALVLPMVSQSYFARLISGIHSGLAGTQYRLVVESGQASYVAQIELLKRLDPAFLAGVIISPPPFQRHREAVRELKSRGLPCVQVTTLVDPEKTPAVIADDFEIGWNAVNMLIEAGHREIAIFDDSADAFNYQQIREGMDRALGKIGHSIRSVPLVEVDANLLDPVRPYEASEEAAAFLLDRYPQVTGVATVDLNRAIGLYRVAHQRGLRIPRDLSLVGCGGDHRMLDTFFVPLTTLDRPVEAIGRRAASLLQQVIAGHPIPTFPTQLQHVLHDRGSVGPPRSRA